LRATERNPVWTEARKMETKKTLTVQVRRLDETETKRHNGKHGA
jgi:hypothetical protein